MWYIIESDMGFCGTDEVHIIEADSESEAYSIAEEELYSRISVSVHSEAETEEEINAIVEEEGLC